MPGSMIRCLLSLEGAILSLLLAAAVTAGRPASATAQVPAETLPPGIEIRAVADPEEATVGDPIKIEIDLIHPKGYRVLFPELTGAAGDFTILETHPGPHLPGQGATAPPAPDPPENAERYRARIIAAVYRVGDFEFPPVQLRLVDSDGREVSVATPPVQVKIQSVLPPDDEELKDLKKQAEISDPTRWVIWLAIGLLVLLLALLYGWWIRKRRKEVAPAPSLSPLDPFDLAEAQLRDLLALGLLEKGFVKQFYVNLSEIAKKCLEAGYDIQTVEKTTGEIMESLHSSSSKADDLPVIETFLSACDMVKFAKYLPSKTENEVAVKDAVRILELSKSRALTQTADRSKSLVGST